MTNLAARVRRYAERHGLWAPGARVAVAVSGGSDSVALLHLLGELADAGHVVVAGVAHLNHQLRADADRDEAFCRDLARHAGLPCDVGRADVAARAREQRCSIEVAARRARYQFLDAARVRLGAAVVAVAHTRDDQAETVLLRLLRGAGTTGLRGILPVRGPFVRPALDCTRTGLRAYLAGRGGTWMDDITNGDLGIPRNRVRHELLPLLATRYQPGVTRLLARTADVARHEEAYLAAHAMRAARRTLATAATGGVQIDRLRLLALPLALRRRVVSLAAEAAGAARSLGFDDIDRLLEVCLAGGAASAVVAGLSVERFQTDAVLLRRGVRPAAAGFTLRSLDVPGVVDLPELGAGWRLRAQGPIQDRGEVPSSAFRAALDQAALMGPLGVRSRLPGDRMRPAGVGGSKKLQDLFVDRKVPRSERDGIPLVIDGLGRIVWVVGVALAEGVGATERSNDVVILSFERLAVAGPEAS